MQLVLDVPPILAYLLVGQNRSRHSVRIIEKNETYPLTGVSLMSTPSPELQHDIYQILQYPGIIKLRSVKYNLKHLECVPTNDIDRTVAIIYDPNVVLAHLKYNFHVPQFQHHSSVLYIKVVYEAIHNLSITNAVIGDVGTTVMWAPGTVPVLNYTIRRQGNQMLIRTNLLSFDLVSSLKLARAISAHLGHWRL